MININSFKRNPALIKLELLLNGLNPKSKIILDDNEACEKYFYDSSKKALSKVPSEIILPGKIVSNFFLSPNSYLSLCNRKLYYDDQEICDIEFTPEAKFSQKVLSDGTLASKVACMYGLGIFSVLLNKSCAYFRNQDECKFCSIEYTRKNRGKGNLINPSVKQVAETLKLALKCDPNLFDYGLISSGAYSDADKGIIEQVKYINTMRKVDGGKLKYHLTTMPPKSLSVLEMLVKKGPDTFSFDMEVFDPDLFREYCPGKEKQIGYDGYLKIIEKCEEIFEKNRVKIGFVAGLESLDSLVKGMEFVGKRGLPPAINVFHQDEGTPLAKHPKPSKNYILTMLKEQTRIYKTYGLIPVFPELGRRTSFDTEVYKGAFENESS